MDFKGQTIACIASGPSLSEKDCGIIRDKKISAIAVNSSWELAPFAKIIFAGDERWWINNYADIKSDAEKWTSCVSAQARYQLYFFRSSYRAWNSGLRAIELAEHLGAKNILLLGYDCGFTLEKHWHPDHKNSSNPTHKVCLDWKKQFEHLSKRTSVKIINCSRETTLTCFPRAELEEQLC